MLQHPPPYLGYHPKRAGEGPGAKSPGVAEGPMDREVTILPDIVWKRWTPEEDAVLRGHYLTYDWDLLERLLPGRTNGAIRQRARHLNAQIHREPDWTPEEEQILRDRLYFEPLKKIAKRLGRSVSGVIHKSKRLGLLRKKRRELSPTKISRLLKVCDKTVLRWLKTGLLTGKPANLKGRKSYLVAPEDLVDFLKKHPEKWDARKCPNIHLALGIRAKRTGADPKERPLWLKEKLAADIRQGDKSKHYTPQEDAQIAKLTRQGMTYEQVGRVIGRSRDSVANRVMRLGQKLWQAGESA